LSLQAKKLEGDDSKNECAAKENAEQAKPKHKSATKSKSTKGEVEKEGAKRKKANPATAACKKQKTANKAEVAGGKNKAVPASLAASANLMASFLKKANQSDVKPKATPSQEKPATVVDA
jgi:hypothetical protein